MPVTVNRIITILLATFFVSQATATEFKSLANEIQAKLKQGEVCLLSNRPDETTPEIDDRFVTMAKLMSGTRAEIWEVLIDRDNAEKFLGGVLESKVIKGSYSYSLKYQLDPEKKATFSFIKGDIKNVAGAWWIFDGPDPKTHYVVYSLHIDPGKFAPQFIVQRGIKKTIPETIISTEKEIIRRRVQTEEQQTGI